MTEITDEYMQQMLGRTKECTIVILKAGRNRQMARAERSWMGTRA